MQLFKLWLVCKICFRYPAVWGCWKRRIFLSCNFYRDHRIELFRIVTQYIIASLHVFLHGDESLPCETNQIIFEAIYKYIQDSKRFVQAFADHIYYKYHQLISWLLSMTPRFSQPLGYVSWTNEKKKTQNTWVYSSTVYIFRRRRAKTFGPISRQDTQITKQENS